MLEEIKTIREALRQKRISYDTWFFVDLDNTVMESKLELGGDQWFTAMLKHAKKMIPDDKQLAFQTVIVIYHELQAHVRVQAVEQHIVGIIKALQDIGIPIFAITARDASIGPSTVRQLRDIGIDFSRNIPEDIPDIEQGIIYCNGKNKGDKLKAFFDKIKRLPAHIACFDDKGSHLEDELKVAVESNVRFNGWRYGFLDEKIKMFDINVANQQLAHIKHRLPQHVQEAVERLGLIPDADEMTLSATHCAHGFFNEDRELPPHGVQHITDHRANRFFRRHCSDSAIDYTRGLDISSPDF